MLGGGTYTNQNKRLPGAYMNLVSEENKTIFTEPEIGTITNPDVDDLKNEIIDARDGENNLNDRLDRMESSSECAIVWENIENKEIFTVVEAPTGIVLDSSEMMIFSGEQKKIGAILIPAGAVGEIGWETSNLSIAAVNNGVIVGASEGSCVITATCNGFSATCTVKVFSANSALINLELGSMTANKIKNIGYGGETYDPILESKNGSFQSVSGGIKFLKNACASMPYEIKNSTIFTVIIKVRELVIDASNNYNRIFRGNGDCPSIYNTNLSPRYGIDLKLAGDVRGNAEYVYVNEIEGIKIERHVLQEIKMTGNAVLNAPHIFAFTGDGADIKYYREGILMGIQKQKFKLEATSIGIGETGTTNYSFNSFILEKFLVYNRALSQEEISAIE